MSKPKSLGMLSLEPADAIVLEGVGVIAFQTRNTQEYTPALVMRWNVHEDLVEAYNTLRNIIRDNVPLKNISEDDWKAILKSDQKLKGVAFI